MHEYSILHQQLKQQSIINHVNSFIIFWNKNFVKLHNWVKYKILTATSHIFLRHYSYLFGYLLVLFYFSTTAVKLWRHELVFSALILHKSILHRLSIRYIILICISHKYNPSQNHLKLLFKVKCLILQF